MAVGGSTTSNVIVLGTASGSSTVNTLTQISPSNVPTGSVLNAVACDSTSSCAIFDGTAGAQSSDVGLTGTTFSAISVLSPGQGSITNATCGATGSCFAVGSVAAGYAPSGENESGDAGLILATNGLTAPTFLPTPLLALESYGGPDGSRPCFTCALEAAGLSAQGFNGDPVNTADGDYTESIPVVSIPGIGPNLSFSATYDSQLAQSEVAAGDSSPPGMLGWGWSTNNAMNLAGTGGSSDLALNEEGGAEITYLPAASGPGFDGSTCTTAGSLQCFVASQPDVTAVLEENLSTSTYIFSRNNGLDEYDFNASGKLTEIVDANGHAETFAYGVTTGTNCTTSGTACDTETDAGGRVLDIVYTTSTGLISKVIDPAGRTWQFSYDSSNDLTGIENPRDYSETFGYDTTSSNPTMVHNMTTLTEPNGQTGGPDAGDHLTIAYEESVGSATAPLGYVISQTDAANILTTFSYAGDAMNSEGTTTITRYVAGSTTAIETESEDEYVGGALSAQVTGVNTSHPETTTFVRNSLDLPTSVTDGNGHTTTYAYDAYGNVLTSTDASSNTWTYTYNQFDELLTATPPSGSAGIETINTYDAEGNLATSAEHPSSGSNLTTTYTVCESATCTVSPNTYVEGEVESVEDPRGYSTTFTYDSYGDLASSTDALSHETTYAYTSIGQLFCTVSPQATHAGVSCPTSPSTRVADTTSSTFDSSDTLVATTTDPNGNTTSYTYDPDDNQTIAEDPLTNSTVTAYDADDRPVSVTAGSGSTAQSVTTTAYDVGPTSTNANCSSSVANATYCTDVTQAEGTGTGTLNAVTASYYDGFGNLIQTTDPGGEVTANTYDQANNLHTTTTGAGETTYAYQPNNWLSSETFSGATSGFSAPSSGTSFTYYGDGARKTMVDSTGTTTYGYGSYGRLNSVVNGAGKTITYAYNQDGEVNCLSYPNAGSTNCLNASSGTGIITYAYNAADLMTGLTDWNSRTISFGYNYNSDWNSTTIPTTTSTSVADTYGNADNLLTQTVTNANLSGGSQSNTWTPNADEDFATTKANSGTAESYGYNALNQVTSLAASDTYTYDQLGRMTSDQVGSTTTNYGYTTDSALCWSGTGSPVGASCSSPPSGSTRYGTDAIDARCYSTTSTSSGTCTSPPSSSSTQSYGYNQLGELTCSTAPNSSSYTCSNPNSSKTTTYTYNGDGLRMSDTPAGGSSQQFTWDVSSSVPDLLSDGTNRYLYGPGGTPVEQINSTTGATNYLVSDPTGVRYQFNLAGTVAGTNTYNPYGKCTSCTATTPFGFEDGYTDATGLIYLVNRYYDTSTDQFITVDPLVSLTGEPFSYAGEDPVNGSDPSGLMCNANPFSGGFWSQGNCLSDASNAAGNWLNNESNTIGCQNGLGNGIFGSAFNCGSSATSSSCPTGVAALNPGSSEADARSALESKGVEIPADYYASPSRNGNGWVFRPEGSTNDDNAIRVMEKGADPQYPNGYYRLYGSKGIPVDGDGTPLGNSGVGQEETHFPLDPDPVP